MKNVARLLPLLLAAFLLFSACSSPTPTASQPTPDVGEVEDVAAPAADYRDLLLKPDELTIGSSPDYPPYESYEGEKLVGFDIELMEAVGEILGLKIVWSPMEFDTIIMAMQSGQVDCGVSGFTWSQDREDSGLLFSVPYVDSAQTVFVLEDSGIESVEDLHGKDVYSSLGTTGTMALEDLGYEDLNIVPGSDFQMGFQMLAEGQVDGVVSDAGVGMAHIENGRPFRAVEPPLLEEENHVLFAPGNELIKEAIDGAIAQFMQTEEYQALRLKFGL